jgi:hypothetical protein
MNRTPLPAASVAPVTAGSGAAPAAAPVTSPSAAKKTAYFGVHGTCLTFADTIQKEGVRASLAGRAGAGFYLWSYINDDGRASELAEDWYQDQLDHGAYSGQNQNGVLLYYIIWLLRAETVNLNSTAHHEAIRSKLERGRGKVSFSQAYNDHIQGLAEAYAKLGNQLKLVEATVPYPQSTKARRRSDDQLTTGGDAYIIQEPGLVDLELIDIRRLR